MITRIKKNTCDSWDDPPNKIHPKCCFNPYVSSFSMVRSPYFIILHDDFPHFPTFHQFFMIQKWKKTYVFHHVFKIIFLHFPGFVHFLTVNSPSHPGDLRGEGAAHESSTPDGGADEDQLRPWQAIRQKNRWVRRRWTRRCHVPGPGCWAHLKIYRFFYSMDWFKGKSTGNQVLPSNIGLSCKFSHHPILWSIHFG